MQVTHDGYAKSRRNVGRNKKREWHDKPAGAMELIQRPRILREYWDKHLRAFVKVYEARFAEGY